MQQPLQPTDCRGKGDLKGNQISEGCPNIFFHPYFPVADSKHLIFEMYLLFFKSNSLGNISIVILKILDF